MVSVVLQLACCKALLLLLLLLLGLVQFIGNCHANQIQQHSSCGDIHNVSFPFKLEGHSGNCTDQDYTLACENNRTVIQLDSEKYYVKAINYSTFTIRLVGVGIAIDNCSSLRINNVNFKRFNPYAPDASQIVFVRCANPAKSLNYINRTASSCGKGYFYVLFGDVQFRDLEDSCDIEMMAFSSSPLLYDHQRKPKSNISFLDIQKAISYGFELRWYLCYDCEDCKRRAACFDAIVSVADVCPSDLKWGFLRSLERIPSYLRALIGQLFITYHHNSISPGLAIVVLIIGARTSCASCVFGFLIHKYRRRHLSMYDSVEGFLRSQNNLMPISYSYSDLKKITKGFSEKLGEGGYGSVYKGKLRSGHFVAVKMLSKPKSDGQEFINEVSTIGRIHHANVVHLVGYCAKRFKRALVYDFMPNGSLEKYIFSREDDSSLSCQQIYEISLGVARGIEYLHQGCDMQILHFDIKPHNILLDENFIPKVSDFGLAKLYPTDDSIVPLTAARGTLGYMAPELFYKNIGGVSYKADVYSFGMLLMEMAGRRRNWNGSAQSSQNFFPAWVYDQFTDGKNIQMEETTEDESERVKKMMMVALWCIQMKPSDRPSMNKVVEMLEGSIENLEMPPKPFLYPQDMPAENQENKKLPNLSGACMDAVTLDFSGR